MLLIIFLGLIAKLTSVSGDCDIGHKVMKNFNFTKFSDPRFWYWRLHSPNNNFDVQVACPVATYASPVGNTSLVTTDAFNVSDQSHITLKGIATNWSHNGWEEIYPELTFLSGRSYVIEVDYKRFVILIYCYFEPNKPYIYVGFRKQDPDEKTWKDVLKLLKKNNINVNEMLDWKPVDCQLAQSSKGSVTSA